MNVEALHYDETDPDNVRPEDLPDSMYQVCISSGSDPHGADAEGHPVDSIRVNWKHFPYVEIKMIRGMKVELVDNGLFITMRGDENGTDDDGSG